MKEHNKGNFPLKEVAAGQLGEAIPAISAAPVVGVGNQPKYSPNDPHLNQVLRPDRKPMNRRVVLGGRASSNEFVPRWVKNAPERMKQAEEAGYRVVNLSQDTGEGFNTGEPTQIAGSVITRKGADGELILMEIRKDFYEQDRSEDGRQIKELETEITRPNSAKGRDKVYDETNIRPKKGVATNGL
jgi:hypothetical protein